MKSRACFQLLRAGLAQGAPGPLPLHLLKNSALRHGEAEHLSPLTSQLGLANAESLLAAACLKLLQPEELPGANPAEPPLAASEALHD